MIVRVMPRYPGLTRSGRTATLPTGAWLDKSAFVNIVVTVPAPMPVSGIEMQAA